MASKVTAWGKHATILPYILWLGLLSGLCPSGYLTKTLYVFIFFPLCTTCLANLIILDNLHLAKSKSYSTPHSAVFSIHLPLHPLCSKHFPQNPFLKYLPGDLNSCSHLCSIIHTLYQAKIELHILSQKLTILFYYETFC
jgi:hypothetical protein